VDLDDEEEEFDEEELDEDDEFDGKLSFNTFIIF
jgi:hypothetical protein